MGGSLILNSSRRQIDSSAQPGAGSNRCGDRADRRCCVPCLRYGMSGDQYTVADHHGPRSVVSLETVTSRISSGRIPWSSILLASRRSSSGRLVSVSPRGLAREKCRLVEDSVMPQVCRASTSPLGIRAEDLICARAAHVDHARYRRVGCGDLRNLPVTKLIGGRWFGLDQTRSGPAVDTNVAEGRWCSGSQS
jgi:hypothetical protein